MTLKEEMQQATDDGRRFIPPYKMALMMKLASKIVTLLTDGASSVTYSYSDMKTVLRIVYNALDEHVQDEKHEHTKEEPL